MQKNDLKSDHARGLKVALTDSCQYGRAQLHVSGLTM